MNISELFIRRPVATILLSVALTLGGLFAYRVLPVAALPTVDFPTVSVSAQLAGAAPETMATSIATPLIVWIDGIVENSLISGVAIEVAMVSGAAPASWAETETVGKSTVGSAATGRTR